MRFSKVTPIVISSIFARLALASAFVLIFCGIPISQASEDTSAAELQAAIGILVPSAESLGNLDGYSPFHLEQKTSVTGGISAVYSSYLSDDPWLTDELPHLQFLIFSYNSQDAAEQELESLASEASLNGKTILEQSSNHIFYESEGGTDVDSYGTLDAEYKSFHYLHKNGNLIFQVSLYRTNGTLNEENLQAYADAIEDTNKIKTILADSIDHTKVVLGALFPPTNPAYTLNSESFSFSLDGYYDLPSHGTISLDVYISEPSGAVGTLLDSAGLGAAEKGDLYLYVNTDGRLFAGIYAPDFDADCTQQSGWYRIETTEALSSYEWNTVALHFGVGGFGIDLNGENVGTCSVSQSRSAKPIYLGDFPGDDLDESMLGYVNNLKAEFSLTDSGKVWDQVLTTQLFLDLPITDPDVRVFEFLKEEGVFLGSDGMLYPDQILNRAEMVKILLKAFDKYYVKTGGLPFWDVPVDAWYRKYLLCAYDVGMIKGHDNGTFMPGFEINRAEFFTMLNRINGPKKTSYVGEFLDVSDSDWFMPGAVYAKSSGLVTNLFFDPDGTISRREAAQFIYQLLKS